MPDDWKRMCAFNLHVLLGCSVITRRRRVRLLRYRASFNVRSLPKIISLEGLSTQALRRQPSPHPAIFHSTDFLLRRWLALLLRINCLFVSYCVDYAREEINAFENNLQPSRGCCDGSAKEIEKFFVARIKVSRSARHCKSDLKVTELHSLIYLRLCRKINNHGFITRAAQQCENEINGCGCGWRWLFYNYGSVSIGLSAVEVPPSGCSPPVAFASSLGAPVSSSISSSMSLRASLMAEASL